jgi:uncharacterized membrane protein YdbT with pleckstrin-like domain
MNYKKICDKIIGKDEQIKYVFSVGYSFITLSMTFWAIISIFFLFFSYSIGIFTFIITIFYHLYYLKIANVYILTNKRMVVKKGWLSNRTISIDYGNITDITIHENFIYRLLTCTGDMIINTAGTDKAETILRHIENPHEVKNIINELKNIK